jgi:hypothetical protein
MTGVATQIPPPTEAEVARVTGLWEQRRQSVHFARYVLKWEWFPIPLPPNSPQPGEDGAFTGTGVVLLDFDNRRLRVDDDERFHNQHRRERLSRWRRSLRYDGLEQFRLRCYDNDDKTAPADPTWTHVEIGPWDQSSLGGFVDRGPLLWGHGFLWPGQDGNVQQFPLDRVAPPERFVAVGRDRIDGRQCVILRDEPDHPESLVFLWVDPERAGAIVRRRIVSQDGATSETTLTYRQTSQGWFPSGWASTHTKPGQSTAMMWRARVESVTFNKPVPPSEFQIALQPGMEISMRNRSYRVEPDASLTLVPRPEPEGTVWPPRAVRNRITRTVVGAGWWGPVGLCLAAAILGVFVWLKKRSRCSGDDNASPAREEGS